MKKLKFSLMLIAAIMLFASTANSQQKAIQLWWDSNWWTPVYCDGAMVDYLESDNVRIHLLYHFVHGEFQKQIAQIHGVVTSSTGEVFKLSEHDLLWLEDDGSVFQYWKFNLKGNRGTHYIGYLTANVLTGEIVEIGEIHCD